MNNRGFTVVELIVGIIGTAFLLVLLAVKIAIIWCLISLCVSGVKSVSHDCGTRYSIESVFSGNWFCPVKENK